MVNRRGFLQAIGAALAGAVIDPERALWIPCRKLISIPKPTIQTMTIEEFDDLYIKPAVDRFFQPPNASYFLDQQGVWKWSADDWTLISYPVPVTPSKSLRSPDSAETLDKQITKETHNSC